MNTRGVLKEVHAQTRERLSGRWLKTIGQYLVAYIPLTVLPSLVNFSTESFGIDDGWGKIGLLMLLAVVYFCISAVLYLGQSNYFLKLAKGDDVRMMDFFCFFSKDFGKAVGLWLRICLKIFLWMFPGLILVFLGFATSLSQSPVTGLWITNLGMGVMVFLGLAANAWYAWMPFEMIKDPSCTAGEAMRRGSVAITGKRKQLVLLFFSVSGWVNAVYLLLGEIAPAVTGNPVFQWGYQILLLVLTAYLMTAYGVFYLKTTKQK